MRWKETFFAAGPAIVSLLLISCLNGPSYPPAVCEGIQLNQVGYYPRSKKLFAVVNCNADKFVIRTAEGIEAYQGALSAAGSWTASKDMIKLGDFSDFTDQGDFYVHIDGLGDSHRFAIDHGMLSKALVFSVRFYYYQRCSASLPAQYAGDWARAYGHADTACPYHTASTGLTGARFSPWGWHDAGDYGKYVVNGGFTVGTLLSFYELYPNAVGDNLHIPESGNGKSDLLDEVKYELDWMKTMQDADGGVFFKLGPTQWPGPVMPADDATVRYIIGKSTTSTLNFCAVMAQSGRVYKTYSAAYSQDCLDRARTAWEWASDHPDVPHPDECAGTGAWDDTDYADEFLWAAAELYASTGLECYRAYLDARLEQPAVLGPAWWRDLTNLAYFTLAARTDYRTAELKQAVTAYADQVLQRINSNPYRTPLDTDTFYWGSNSIACNFGVPLAYAFYFTGDARYLDGIVLTLDYLLGRNAVGRCFLTGFGDRRVLRPCHYPSTADGVAEPVPGMLTGGPNKEKNDNLQYPTNEPAKCYLDVPESYASNEPCISANAPLVFLLGAVEANRNLLQ